MKKEGFSQSAVLRIIERSKGRCANPKCGNHFETEIHHVFFRSQYHGKDRHQAWNGANICRACHDSIHHLGGRAGQELDFHLKRHALYRYAGDRREQLKGYVTRLKIKLYGSKNKEGDRGTQASEARIRRPLPSEQGHHF